jgi:hypothetical protein
LIVTEAVPGTTQFEYDRIALIFHFTVMAAEDFSYIDNKLGISLSFRRGDTVYMRGYDISNNTALGTTFVRVNYHFDNLGPVYVYHEDKSFSAAMWIPDGHLHLGTWVPTFCDFVRQCEVTEKLPGQAAL